jgi:uncharacterized protein (UPF0248 family)
MQPIHELLSQIRWDRNFAGDFEIAFTDREKAELERISVRQMHFTDSKFSFEFRNDADEVVSIPLHRIRRVYRNGEVIWSRPE